jgi:chromosome segregation ATPase
MELTINDKNVPQEELDNYNETIAAIEREAEIRQKESMAKLKMDQAEHEKKITELNAEREELTQKLNEIDEQRAKLGYDKNGADDLSAKLYQDKSLLLQNHNWDDGAKQDLLKDLQEKAANEQNQLFDVDRALKLKWDSAAQQIISPNKGYLDYYLEDLLQNRGEINQNHDLLFDEQRLPRDNSSLEGLRQRSYVLIDPIIEEMIEEKIIPPHQDEISFELNSRSFIVNGKKQSADVHQRFKNRFLKNSGDYIKCTRKDGHTSTSINLD